METTVTLMKPSAIGTALETLIKIRQPCFVWGPPGIGKSQKIRQVCDKMGYKLLDIRATLLDPVDLRGLPTISQDNGQTVKWHPPGFLPAPEDGKAVILLDELNSAPPSVQAACYQLVLDRQIGEYTLPDDCVVLAAGNRETDRAVTHRMPSALANRFVHLYLEPDFKDWKNWAVENEIAPEVIAALTFRPELLNQFDPKKNDKAFPSSRTWEFVSNIIKSNPYKDVLFPLLVGTVGEGAAIELISFLEVWRSLPDPRVVIQSPETAEVPDDPATLYAICGALSSIVDTKNFSNIKMYADRLPAEYSVLLILDCTKKNQAVCNTDAYIRWVTQNQDVIL
jgi:MoxR-like ATPase